MGNLVLTYSNGFTNGQARTIDMGALTYPTGATYVRHKVDINSQSPGNWYLSWGGGEQSYTNNKWGNWYSDENQLKNVNYPGRAVIKVRNSTGVYSTPTITLTIEYTDPNHSVTVSAGTGGTASASKTSAGPGETITITCSPSNGYSANTPTASGITFTAAGTNKWTFTMPSSNVTVSCTFTKISYNVSITAGSGGSAVRDKTTATIGETVTVTCTPNSGYKANTPTASGITFTSAGTNKWTFTMPAAAVSISCTFSKVNYNVTANAGSGGSASSNKATAQIGDVVTITCSPNTGYSANTPTATGITFTSAGTNKWTFVMPAAAVTVSCTFTKITYTISKASSPSAGGTVTIGATSANYGDQVTVSQTAASGYVFTGWTITPSGVTVSNGKITMPAGNVSITANYAKLSTGSISSSMTGGGTATLTITAEKTSYSHKYKLSFGTNMETSLTAVAAGTTSVQISIPDSWSNYIPSATSKTGGSLILETYNGSTKLGQTTISNLTYNVRSNAVPTLSDATKSVARTIGGTTYANVGDVYVQNKCGVRVQATASGVLGSTISKIEVSLSGYTADAYKGTVNSGSLDWTSGLLTNSGTVTITTKATDSRGRTATKTTTISVLAYNRPNGSLQVRRVNSAGDDDPMGTYAKYQLSKSFSSVGSNSLTWSISSQGSSYSSPADTGNLLPSSRQTFSETLEYQISLSLTDAFETVTIIATLPTAQFILFMNANGDRIGVMKATNENLSKNGKSGTIELSSNHQIYVGNVTLENYIRGVINGTIT